MYSFRYVELVLQQRIGPVRIDMQTRRPDMTVLEVPKDCVGYVTGRGGQVLRSLEFDWGTLMFFAKDEHSAGGNDDIEKLAIFGPRRARRGAELKVRRRSIKLVYTIQVQREVQRGGGGGAGREVVLVV